MSSLDEEFYRAFSEAAVEVGRVPIGEVVASAVRSVDEIAERDGRTPDVLVLILGNDDFHYHNNGVTFDRLLWMVESYKHVHLLGED